MYGRKRLELSSLRSLFGYHSTDPLVPQPHNGASFTSNKPAVTLVSERMFSVCRDKRNLTTAAMSQMAFV